MDKAHPIRILGGLSEPNALSCRLALAASGLVLALVVLVAPGRAETAEGCLDGSAVTDVRNFVAAETGHLVPEVCIRSAPQERLTLLAGSAVRGQPPGDAVAAVYIPASGQILLAEDLDLGTLFARSHLVHELVHAQQFAARAQERASCPGLLEADAYDLQALYLRMRGLREEALLLQVLGMFQSACGHAY